MAGLAHLFEPEELIGGLWHRLVSDTGSEPRYCEAAIGLNDMRRRLEIFFRGLGGEAGIEIKAMTPQSADHRQSLAARLAAGSKVITRARFDGDRLFLPETIDLLPRPDLNEALYKWLTAFAAVAARDTLASSHSQQPGTDPLRNDIKFIRFAIKVSKQVIEEFPGLSASHETLCKELLANRPTRKLPAQESAVEASIRALLGDADPAGDAAAIWRAITTPDIDLAPFTAAAGYKTFMPLILWGEITPQVQTNPTARDTTEHDTASTEETADSRTRKARRKNSDQIERADPLIINRFEAILSWAEMLNINRGVDDDDEDAARKAADDQEELGLANISRKTATRLKFDLDLAPEDVEHERLADKFVYPEWDYRNNVYHADHCRVLAATAPEMQDPEDWQPDASARRRIRAVKRQFEALRPKRERLHRQIDGCEIDMDALIRARCDMTANGDGSTRVFTATRISATTSITPITAVCWPRLHLKCRTQKIGNPMQARGAASAP